MGYCRITAGLGLVAIATAMVVLWPGCGGSKPASSPASSTGPEEVAVKYVEALISRDREAAKALFDPTEPAWSFDVDWNWVGRLQGCTKSNIEQPLFKTGASGDYYGFVYLTLDPPCGEHQYGGGPHEKVVVDVEQISGHWYVTSMKEF